VCELCFTITIYITIKREWEEKWEGRKERARLQSRVYHNIPKHSRTFQGSSSSYDFHPTFSLVFKITYDGVSF